MTSVLTGPTLIEGLSDDLYHSGGIQTPGPQLSQSMLKLLIPPSTPAHFQWRATHPEPPRRVFDIGRAAHTLALGIGDPVVACPDDLLSSVGTMTTKAAREWSDAQRSAGFTPLTPRDYSMVYAMAEALVHHDRVAELLTDPTKRPEVSAFAPHPDVPAVWFRGRFDLLGGDLWDYKTTACAEPSAFRKSAWAYGYHVQDVLYRTLLEAVTGEVSAPMVFLVQEKTPPYLCSVVTLDSEFERLAREQIASALALYLACVEACGAPDAAGVHWPGYRDEIALLSPPPYADRGVEGIEYEPEF